MREKGFSGVDWMAFAGDQLRMMGSGKEGAGLSKSAEAIWLLFNSFAACHCFILLLIGQKQATSNDLKEYVPEI